MHTLLYILVTPIIAWAPCYIRTYLSVNEVKNGGMDSGVRCKDFIYLNWLEFVRQTIYVLRTIFYLTTVIRITVHIYHCKYWKSLFNTTPPFFMVISIAYLYRLLYPILLHVT